MKQIALKIPEPWVKPIDKARGSMFRNEWIRCVIRDALRELGLWPEGESVIKTLEQDITELWKRRDLEVLDETVSPLSGGVFEWRIIAKPKKGKVVI